MNTTSTIKPTDKLLAPISYAFQLFRLHPVIGIALPLVFLSQFVRAVNPTAYFQDTVAIQQLREQLKKSNDTLSQSPEAAMDLIIQAHDLLEKANDSLLSAEMYYLKGKIHDKLGDYASSISEFKESAHIYQQLEDHNGYAKAMNYLGVTYDQLGDYDEALRHYLISLNVLDESNPQGLIYINNNIALIYMANQSYDKARAHLMEAVHIAKESDLNHELTYPYHNIGDLHSSLQEYDSALSYYKKSYVIDTAQHDKVGIGINLKSMAEVYKKQQQLEEARSHLVDALSYLEEGDDKYNLSAVYSSLGEIYMLQKQFDKAIKYARKGLTLASELSAKAEIQHAAGVLSETYKASGDFEQALLYTDIFHQYKDSIFNENKNRELTLLQLKQAEAEKDLLKVDNEIQTAKMGDQLLLIEKQTYIVILISFGLIISIVFLVILNNANRDKKITNQQLLNQRKEIENIISKLKILYQDIEKQKNELEQSNRIKDKLISIISHDFRSPLNSLEGVLVLFTEGQIKESEMKVLAQDLRLKVNITTSLLDNLLNWAKNQMQGINPGPEAFDVSTLTLETIHLVEMQAENKGVIILDEISSHEHTMVFADYEMMKLVLRNLLSNAIKFTKKGDKVVIKASKSDDFFSIFIQDSGVGISNEQLEFLFTNQTNSTLGTSQEKGTGLGLMLCKDFVEKNGGQIMVQTVEGEGSTFSFTIPTSKTNKKIDIKKKNELKHA